MQFTPEQELLLWSIRVDHIKDHQIIDILTSGVDWEYIREGAVQHGIFPLLYKRLKEEMSDFVPPTELATLKCLFMTNACNNFRMTQQLFKVFDLFAAGGIEAISFKGLTLAVQAYHDTTLRAFGDLDILVHKEDFERAFQLLENTGFQPDHPLNSHSERKFMFFQTTNLNLSSGDTSLELHWRIVQRYLSVPFRMDQLWKGSLSVIVEGRAVRTLSLEDMVLVLCVHGTKHLWEELKWLADLIYLISNTPDLKWQEIYERAEKLGLRRILSLSLDLAQKYGGIGPPGSVGKPIASDIDLRTSVAIIEANFFPARLRKWSFAPPGFYLKLRERLHDKANILFYTFTDRIILPNHLDFMVISLPDLLFPVYFIIRPFRLLKDYWGIKTCSR